MSVLQKVISSQGYRFYYIRAITADNRDAWYFVKMHPNKIVLFDRLDPNSAYDLNDYGDIIESGYGEYAPPETINEINIKYNCKFTD